MLLKDSFKNKNEKPKSIDLELFSSFATAIKYSDSKFKCAKTSSSILINSYDLHHLCLDSVIRFTLFTYHLHLLQGIQNKINDDEKCLGKVYK